MSTGKISAIKYEYNGSVKNMTNSLLNYGRTRYPGTSIYAYPKKLLSGKYATGLDENSKKILSIQDAKERKAEQKRIKDKRERLEIATGLDLSPTSKYWDYSLYTDRDRAHVQAVKLYDGENSYDLSDPFKEIEFTWLKEHDLVAPSYEAYIRGDKGPHVRFYVHDEEVENKRKFDRKKLVNKATVANEKLSPNKRKKVAVLMGLPVSDNSKESAVYNAIDDVLKQTEFKEGKYRGLNPVKTFLNFIEMDSKLINVKHLVKEALDNNIYRHIGGSALYEGELQVAEDEGELVNKLMDDDNQEELIALENRVKAKKSG